VYNLFFYIFISFLYIFIFHRVFDVCFLGIYKHITSYQNLWVNTLEIWKPSKTAIYYSKLLRYSGLVSGYSQRTPPLKKFVYLLTIISLLYSFFLYYLNFDLQQRNLPQYNLRTFFYNKRNALNLDFISKRSRFRTFRHHLFLHFPHTLIHLIYFLIRSFLSSFNSFCSLIAVVFLQCLKSLFVVFISLSPTFEASQFSPNKRYQTFFFRLSFFNVKALLSTQIVVWNVLSLVLSSGPQSTLNSSRCKTVDIYLMNIRMILRGK